MSSHDKPKRKLNPGMKAFLDLSKYIADELGIPNGPPAKKIASRVKKSVDESNPGLSMVDALNKKKEHFSKNKEFYLSFI